MKISLGGAACEKALRAYRRQLRQWRLAMPAVDPLVLDFGLGEFYKTGLIEYWIANEAKAGYCGKYLFVFDGQTCPLHRHRVKHETFLVVKGAVRMRYRGRVMSMREGAVLPVAPWGYHSFTGQGPALLLELSTPCEIDDNFFHDRRIPIGGNRRDAV